MANRHIREGEAHVSRQREIIAQLQRDGHATATAESLLSEFETTLDEHKEHKALIEREIAQRQ